jgi:hypothetical protein
MTETQANKRKLIFTASARYCQISVTVSCDTCTSLGDSGHHGMCKVSVTAFKLVLAKHKSHYEHHDFILCYRKNVLFLSFEPNAAYKIQLLYNAVKGQYVFKVNSASAVIRNLEFTG